MKTKSKEKYMKDQKAAIGKVYLECQWRMGKARRERHD